MTGNVHRVVIGDATWPTPSRPLTVEDRRAWEQDLVRYYLDHLHAAGGRKLVSTRPGRTTVNNY
ncbi:hypothetical protein TUM20985_39930 [Mycobacterium antarcticum]|nr:hypothetical protein TUM20985_39930 [Mycolicibacterium sp. TUM20985]GLP82940.1 hypothetical protein TUM20984_43600 [Mycolicibacterium sp. TUM20984]